MTDEANAAAQPAQAETTSSWYTEEYKPLVESKGWKQPADALKSYRELEKDYSGKVRIPDEKATPEERKKFYTKLGCPEKPEDYEISVDESLNPLRDETTENYLKGLAHQNGLSKTAFDNLVKGYYGFLAENKTKSLETGREQLRADLGDRYDAEVKIAQRFASGCSEEFRQLMETTGLGNNPVVVKEFINLGKKTMSDSIIRGDTAAADPDYKPKFPTSPDMYKYGEDEESRKARAYFTARGHKYD